MKSWRLLGLRDIESEECSRSVSIKLADLFGFINFRHAILVCVCG